MSAAQQAEARARAAEARADAQSLLPSNYIQSLRDQIKCLTSFTKSGALADRVTANASLLFPNISRHGTIPQLFFDIVIMTYAADDAMDRGENHRLYEVAADTEKPKMQAVLTYYSNVVAARGPPCDDYIGSLEALLLVTATALEKFQGNIMPKPPKAPTTISGGMIDEALVVKPKSKGLFS